MPPNAMAMVTGAGSGIGRAISRKLASCGFNLALVGRNRDSLEETSRIIHSPQPHAEEVLIIPADLADPDQCAGVVETVLTQWPAVDALINNAARGEVAPLASSPDEMVAQTFAINFLGPLHLITHLWPHWIDLGRGRIINISSMATIDPFPGLGIYAASKCALESITRSIMNEGGEAGLEAWSVAPGAVETAMLRAIISEKDLPREHTLDPDEIARVVAECALGQRKNEIGQTILLPSPA